MPRMPPSLKFALAAVAAVALCLGTYAWLARLACEQPVWPHHWMRAVWVAQNRIAEDTVGRRVLLIGGSSVWFGFHSAQLEQELGQPVVNLGLNAALPLDLLLQRARARVRPGDTVVAGLEGTYFVRAEAYTTPGAEEAPMIDPGYLDTLSPARRWQWLASVTRGRIVAGIIARAGAGRERARRDLRLQTEAEIMEDLRLRWAGKPASAPPPFYHVAHLGPRGDFSTPRPDGHWTGSGLPWFYEEPWVERTFRQMAEFSRQMRALGVDCYFVWPPLVDDQRPWLEKPETRSRIEELARRISGCGWRIIGKPEDSIYPRAWYHDTPHHLTDSGAHARTGQLVRWLKEASAATQAPLAPGGSGRP